MYWFAWKKRKNSDLFLYIVIMLRPTWLQDFVRLYAAHELKWVYTWLIMIFRISKVHSQEAEWLYLDNKHFFVQILFLLLLSHNHVQTLSQPERSPWGFCELQSTHPDDDANRYPILLQTQAKIFFFSFNSSYRLNSKYLFLCQILVVFSFDKASQPNQSCAAIRADKRYELVVLKYVQASTSSLRHGWGCHVINRNLESF